MSYKFQEGEQVFVCNGGQYHNAQGIIVRQGTPYLVKLYNADRTELELQVNEIESRFPATELGSLQRRQAILNYELSVVAQEIEEYNKDQELRNVVKAAASNGLSKTEAQKILDEAYSA